MRQVFVDPSVLLLAIGGEHPWREPCREVLEAASDGRLQINLSVEGGQEFLFHRLRHAGRERAVREFFLVDAMVAWHPFDVETLHASRDLIAAGHARGRDAVHAATAMAQGFGENISCDADFDTVPGLGRIDPTTSTWG
ncbi:type II toxin-antitoxin system VapC family toxin [Yimella sp. cx-51]|uniref:type II toxin-antitoxin system VapC family toxin n=1 Tax=Yimella sp. cx-51 TaxID=2770551 RepID=UPI00165D5B3D|nr:type II toxin-antitoxin system VapC family toxin [Yimella sp. cx-51]MBC9956815.1 type II toxin-antitoxin system VapC family toxin [Yimella sp. cx-51]MBD2759243.1 type II toxin-antitoxin system VapC family toxin [Yimella sp. cx-573]QTH39044.1 type II toxin-antitoxin system VapC family toxin [Yimella sp. cx-51]